MKQKANSLFFCLLVFLCQDTEAKTLKMTHKKDISHKTYNHSPKKKASVEAKKQEISSPLQKASIGPKPKAWCGWYMRQLFGGGPEYNVAANWAKRGQPSEAKVGAIVVWPHHVGYISGRTKEGQWLVTSGNDGNAIKTRPNSLKGIIAIRAV